MRSGLEFPGNIRYCYPEKPNHITFKNLQI